MTFIGWRRELVSAAQISIVGSLIVLAGCSKDSPDGATPQTRNSSSGAGVASVDKSVLTEDEAIQQLYGGTQWDAPRLATYFRPEAGSDKPRTHAFVSSAFLARFKENGQEKVAFIARLTPEPIKQYDCHACDPVIGGAVFVRSGSTWKIESKTEIIQALSAWENRFSVVQVGEEHHGILLQKDDNNQGYESKSINLLTTTGTMLSSVLAAGFSESPGDGVCEDAKPQTVGLAFKPVAGSEYFNAVIDVQRNMGECGHLSTETHRNEYVFKDEKYLPITDE